MVLWTCSCASLAGGQESLPGMGVGNQIRPCAAQLRQKPGQLFYGAIFKNIMGKQGFVRPPALTVKAAVQIRFNGWILHSFLLIMCFFAFMSNIIGKFNDLFYHFYIVFASLLPFLSLHSKISQAALQEAKE